MVMRLCAIVTVIFAIYGNGLENRIQYFKTSVRVGVAGRNLFVAYTGFLLFSFLSRTLT